MPATKSSISEVLRQAVRDSGLSNYALEKATGVTRSALGRFMSGRTSLHLDIADRLAKYLGVEARATRRARRSQR